MPIRCVAVSDKLESINVVCSHSALSFGRQSLMLRVLIYASTVGRQKNRLKLKKMTTWSRSMKPSTGISGRCLIKGSSGTRTLQSVEERVPDRSRLSFSRSKTRARWTSLRTRFRMILYLVSVLLDRRQRVAYSLPSAKDVSPA